MSPIGKAVTSARDRYGELRATTVSALWATIFKLAIVFSPWLPAGAADASTKTPQIQGEHLRIEFDRTLHSRVVAPFGGKETAIGPFVASERVAIDGKIWSEFPLASQKNERVSDAFGAGERLVVAGKSGPLTKEVSVTIYDEFPTMALFDVRYTNAGSSKLAVKGWTNNAYTLNAQRDGRMPAFWSYQSGSYEKRPDWLVPLHANFRQENFLGMNASDYGGGTPVVDVWRRDVGAAVGHVDPRPRLVSLPVSMPDSAHARIAVNYQHAGTLEPGETLSTLRTFVAVHQGDYFRTLVDYRRFMMKRQGFQAPPPPDSAFGPIWCAWGYGRTMQPKQLLDTLPTVKRMGFVWVTLDDGWQNNVGDWALDPRKYPRGDADMKALVDQIHAEGFRAQLWWSPLSAVPSSQLLKDHPDYELRNRDGSARKISWWDSHYLCPADHRVVEYHKALVRKILVDWGFDGLKLDGQHMNGVPACYNPAHHHQRPEESVEALPDFFREIFATAQTVKPGALVEFCPCGTAYSFFTTLHFNMSVASDPGSSFQVRSKGKTLKALMGDSIPYFGDHVELSDGGDDFASTVGVGGVVGTQFVLPALAEKPSKSDLTASREKEFETWLRIYREKMLSQGQYLGQLYDIGFDVPETHVIRKQQTLYYAFYARHWKGPVELRGLEARTYDVVDYVNGTRLGTVSGDNARLTVEFDKHLLLEARPQ
ncbi:MAG TPA: glycoside hydrolase family 36 protein [Candidatus Sulfotelmatobacter sp.]|nr:glycoside hydrolase family 36 protein [Candidatus Sulfotelmatobacter sp.]